MTTYWPAPAKLNLFLHITGRRTDGYHLLQSVFQFVDLCDQLQFSIRSDTLIQRQNEISGLESEDDICVKAARLLQRECGCQQGVDIQIEKKIPMGGGLGGGSSDAATTLLALNHLWGCQLSQVRLETLALQLGADVPIFVRGLACWAEGVGEELQTVQIAEPWYVIIAPPVSIPTAEIFSAEELTRDTHPITIRDLEKGAVWNDCQAVVEARYPEVAEGIKWLSQYTKAQMTGTGACLFGAFDTQAEAEKVLQAFNSEKATPWRAFVTKGLNRSPVLNRLEAA